ncbi:MAG: hypothetical protein HUU35_04390 [Armatimonadetes bacterium]|nr:hypothetical protein [Armatimonadota bacterium]
MSNTNRAMLDWLDQARVGTVAVLPGDEAIEIARYGNALGVWGQGSRRWLFGGPGLRGRSLRAIRHWLAARLGVGDYRSLLPCQGCGAEATCELETGLHPDDGGEEYRVRCPICGGVELWCYDARDLHGEILAELAGNTWDGSERGFRQRIDIANLIRAEAAASSVEHEDPVDDDEDDEAVWDPRALDDAVGELEFWDRIALDCWLENERR